jgi:V8-like Glu-specific endopeptidase
MLRTYHIRKFAGAALLTAIAVPSQSTIFDRDDRQYVSTAPGSPYAPIGKVIQGRLIYKWSTGVLVDKCNVLTSQHVFGTGQTPVGKRLTFKAALGTPQRVSSTGTVVAVGGYEPTSTWAERSALNERDWLLLRLDKCIGASLGYAALKTGPYSPYEFENVQSAGYPVRRHSSKSLTLDPACRITYGIGSVWMNDCATVRGDAGDPLFRISAVGGKPRLEVMAIQVAGYNSYKPMPTNPKFQNEAVPIALIAPQIEPHLSTSTRPE